MTKNGQFALALALSVGAAGTTFGDMRELAFHVALPAREAPKMDGVLDDACWKGATVHSDYYEWLAPNPRRVTNTKTDCMIVYDEKGVYTGIRNWEDQPEKLRQNCRKNNRGIIWKDDSGEIYFDPDAAGIGYYKFVVNSLGKYDTSWRMDGANFHEDWTCGGVVCAAKVFADRWEVELFVPWSAFHGRPAPKAGDVWTFNHSRYRFGARKVFSTSAPGASGVSANKFGYLYFSDGAKPDAKRVLAILEKRLKVDWGISIDGKVYLHDATGTRETDLIAGKESLETEFRELEAALAPRIAKGKNKDYAKRFKAARTSFTNELAKFDGSFAAVKVFGELVDGLKDLDRRLAIGELASKDPAVIASARKLDLPLAGSYDLTPPEAYDGHNGWHRHNFIRGAYPTPHLAWTVGGEDPATGPKILFMPGVDATVRDCIEFVQRFGAADTYFPGNFGATGIYQDPLSLGTSNDKRAQFETLLAKNPELIVQHGFKDGEWPSKYRYEVLRRVRDEGLGLVIVGEPKGFDGLLRRLTPAKADAKLKLYDFGKGRIAVVDMGRPGNGWSLTWRAEYETCHAFLYGVFQWALGKKPGADIVFAPDSSGDDFAADLRILAFDARVADGGADTLFCRLRTVYNEIVSEQTFRLKDGANPLSVPTERIAGGAYILDLIAAKGGKTTAVVVKSFTKASALGKILIDGTNRTVVAEGQAGSIRATWDEPVPADATLRFELRDRPYGQLREKGEIALRAGSRVCTVEFSRATFPTLAGDLKVSVIAADGREFGSARKVVYFPNHRFEDYTLISWGGGYNGGLELFGPKLVDEFGYRNHLAARGSDSADFNCRAVPYAAHVSLGAGKTNTSWRTYEHTLGKARKGSVQARERAALGEDWNIYRPEVRAHIEKYFTPKVKASAPYGVCVWSLGDECVFSTDIGFGPAGDRYFAEFLARKYGTIGAFNAVHGTSYAGFAEVPHRRCEDCVDAHDWPGWFDQVQYAQRMYSDTYQFLSGVIRKYDPRGRVGAEGSAGGDLELTVDKLEFWGPYRSLVADELLRNIAADRVRGTWWGGYLRSTRNGFPVKQWEYVLTGTVNADEWFCVVPGATEGSHAGDLMPYPYVQRMMPHLRKLRRGQAQQLIRTPWREDGFAFYYSHPSLSAAALDDRFLPQDESLGDLIRFCYRKGYNVKMITRKTIAKLDGQKVLFLAGATALSDEEAATFRDFAAKGGIVVADAPPALLTDCLAIRRENPLGDLFGDWTLETLKEPVTGAAELRGAVTLDGRTSEFAVKGENVKTFPGVKPLAWRSVGKGGAFLVGTTFSSVLVNGGEDAVDRLVQGLLNLKGIVMRESCTGLSAGSTIFRVRELPRTMVLAGVKTDVTELGKDVTIDFGREGWVYEVDTGFVAKAAKVEMKKIDVPFRLFAQFGDEQREPAFKLDRTEIAAGDWVSFETEGLRQGSVYRLEVADTDGRAIACREELFCADAKTEPKRSFQFPFSDRAGVYKTTLRDIATGLETTVAVTVR